MGAFWDRRTINLPDPEVGQFTLRTNWEASYSVDAYMDRLCYYQMTQCAGNTGAVSGEVKVGVKDVESPN